MNKVFNFFRLIFSTKFLVKLLKIFFIVFVINNIWEIYKLKDVKYVLEKSILLFSSWSFISIVLVLIFKNAITSLLGRIKNVGKNGVNFHEQPVVKSDSGFINKIEKPLESKSKIPELPEDAYKPVIEGIEKQLKVNLKNFNGEEINILARELANSRLELYCERIYSFIYGSQILALEFLSLKTEVDKNSLLKFYNNASKEFNEVYKNISFDIWYDYLIRTQLAYEFGDLVSIGMWGKPFLNYLNDSGYPKNKPY